MPQLQSGVGTMAKKWKINLICTDPITVFCSTTILHVPMPPQMFSTPGTFTKFTVQLSSPAQVDSGTTSLYRLPVHLRMELELPSLLWGSFHPPHSPWEWSELQQDGSQCPPMVTGQIPPAQIVTALMVYAMASCTA